MKTKFFKKENVEDQINKLNTNRSAIQSEEECQCKRDAVIKLEEKALRKAFNFEVFRIREE